MHPELTKQNNIEIMPGIISIAILGLFLIIIASQATINATNEAPPPTKLVSVDEVALIALHPQTTNETLTLIRDGYQLGYSEQLGQALWAIYRLTATETLEAPERPEGFRVDLETSSRVNTKHYTRTGYDRGHLAPSYGIGLCYGPHPQEQTFLMSNIAPQRPNLNRYVWREIEMLNARTYAQHREAVVVITGPVFTNSPIVYTNGFALPDAFFKIVYDTTPNGITAQAFMVPQTVERSSEPEEHLVSIDQIELLTHLNFGLNMKGEEQIESNKLTRLWNPSL